MNDLRTDDRGRRNEYIYRGPESLPFPWRARLSTQLYTLFTAVALWLLMATVVPAVIFEAVPYVPAVVVKAVFVAVAGAFLALVLGMVVGPQITKITPPRYWVQVLSAELNAPRPAARTRTPAAPVTIPGTLWKREPRTPGTPIDPSSLTGR